MPRLWPPSVVPQPPSGRYQRTRAVGHGCSLPGLTDSPDWCGTPPSYEGGVRTRLAPLGGLPWTAGHWVASRLSMRVTGARITPRVTGAGETPRPTRPCQRSLRRLKAFVEVLSKLSNYLFTLIISYTYCRSDKRLNLLKRC